MNILGYTLKELCGACPEDYDVFDSEGTQVGYLHLRYGRFTATCPDWGGIIVYRAEPNGDGLFDQEERKYYLTSAVLAIMKHLRKESK